MNAIDALTKGTAATTATAATGAGAGGVEDAAGSADRFLKLLVAQMQNQDPLNPLDNAQVTSQLAQINTVNGIEKLNKSIEAMSGRFAQMQGLQGAALVGRSVLVDGNRLTPGENGAQQGMFQLASAADRVQVEVIGRAGNVIERLELGALDKGRQPFDWRPKTTADAAAVKEFRVVATAGAAAVAATPMVRDRVDAVATDGNTLTLELRTSGSVPYERIKAFN